MPLWSTGEDAHVPTCGKASSNLVRGTKFMKKCYKCNIIKENNEFNKDKTRPDGLQSKCRSCDRLILKQWKYKNLEHVKEYDRSYSQIYQNKTLSQVKLSKLYKISRKTIQNIKKKENWIHITDKLD